MGPGHRPLVTDGLGEGQPLGVQLHRTLIAAVLAGHAAQHLEGVGHAAVVPGVPEDAQRGLQAADRRHVVALQEGEPPATQQDLGPQGRGGVRAVRGRAVHPVPDLVVVTAQVGILSQ